MIKVLPLKGFKALRAFNAFNALLLGVKMLPANQDVSYEEFFESLKDISDGQRETILREAVAFVNLEREEVEALLSFTTDKNGIPFNQTNIDNLGPEDLIEAIVAVCMEIGKIKITLVTEEEKKKYQASPLT